MFYHRDLVFQFLLSKIILISIIMVTFPAQAIYIRHDIDVAEYVRLANAPSYMSAGWFAAPHSQPIPGSPITITSCSGTLVAPNKFLTAAHCLDDNEDGNLDYSISWMQVGFGFNRSLTTTSNISNAVLHPKWSSTEITDEERRIYDLAILSLSAEITNIKPAILWGHGVSPYSDGMGGVIPFTGVMVGYGQQNQGDGNSIVWGNLSSRQRLAALNAIDTGKPLLETDFDSLSNPFYSSKGNSTPLRLEGSTCFGDSGGPLFIQGNYLVGVAQSITNSSCTYGTVASWSPIGNSENIKFLKNNSLIPVSEPDMKLLFLLGYVLMIACCWNNSKKRNS